MKIPELPFTAIDWPSVEPSVVAGETGTASQRQFTIGDLSIRLVAYSSGYRADHWCDKGHVGHVVAGALEIVLEDGRRFPMRTGMSFAVSDFGDSPHRVETADGATVFLVD